MIASLNPGEKQARKWLRLAMIVTVGLSVLVLALYGIYPAYAILLGGVACVLPNYIFANRLFAHQGAVAAAKIVRSFLVGEVLKLVSMALLIWFALSVLKAQAAWLLGGFVVVLLVVISAPLLLSDTRENKSK